MPSEEEKADQLIFELLRIMAVDRFIVMRDMAAYIGCLHNIPRNQVIASIVRLGKRELIDVKLQTLGGPYQITIL